MLLILWCTLFFLHSFTVDSHSNHEHSGKNDVDDPHAIPMGIRNSKCDDGVNDVEVDWDPQSTAEFTCTDEEIPATEPMPNMSCIPQNEMLPPRHTCLWEKIVYEDIPPRGGPHRPLWPKFGEYTFCPPQRWVHTLEHGAVVFLYHPCAEESQITEFKSIASNCLWKHILTPYKDMEQPFAVVTYGCRLTINAVDRKAIVDFVQEKGLKGPEGSFTDGQYTYGLLHPSAIVSDEKDSVLCPNV